MGKCYGEPILQTLARRLFNEMHQRFGIGVRTKLVPGCTKLLPKNIGVLDYPVVYEDKPARTVGVWMGIQCCGSAVGCPARVSDATGSVDALLTQHP